ncbi:hypothetical protein SmJEL517_g02867 [Synchytrium microbalum]|uniref:Meiosis-specific nuclear structural protein 1 n=1 Tax=Synchytrium microbalum TaxID=1806994 RepID=A0A507C939_9FUNG|nr:uncharacterized protein SmJEL517_g02867 [Synchytrium microbalum]TPX34506.1 hypothetical protein SmJEL517_g02867 [Synchytrium microbalum]
MNVELSIQREMEQRRQAVAQRMKEEEDMEAGVEARRIEILREEKLRQSIRIQSEELRTLETKLRAGYMNKERAAQIAEKRLKVQQARVDEAQWTRVGNKRQQELEVAQKLKEKANVERREKYKTELEDQLAYAQVVKQRELETFLRDKQQIDEIVNRIAAEDARQQQIKMEKQRETKEYIAKFMVERQEWQTAEQARQEEENKRIEQFAVMQDQRVQEKVEKKKEEEQARDKIYNKLASSMATQELLRTELEELRIDLSQAEGDERARRQEEALLQARIQRRLELLDAYRQSITAKAEKRKLDRQDEDRLRDMMMKERYDQEKLDQMSQAKRRMKQLEHARAIQTLLEERRQRLAVEEQEEKAQGELDAKFEKYRQEVIESERQRLLREHAKNLVGFLPKGILRDRDDLKYLGEAGLPQQISYDDEEDY